MKNEELFRNLQETYTQEEAKAAIDSILEKYGETVRISFRKKDAEIVDSYLVNSQDDRHTICEIIHRTGVTQRDYEDLSAEWMVHNAAYKAHVGRQHAKDVSLDYDKDPRRMVRAATGIFDKLDIE